MSEHAKRDLQNKLSREEVGDVESNASSEATDEAAAAQNPATKSASEPGQQEVVYSTSTEVAPELQNPPSGEMPEPEQLNVDTSAATMAEPAGEPAGEPAKEPAEDSSVNIAEISTKELPVDTPIEPAAADTSIDEPKPSGQKHALEKTMAGLKEPKKLTELTSEKPPILPDAPANPLSGPNIKTGALSDEHNVNLSDISFAQWASILDKNNLLYGYRPALTGENQLAFGADPAFQAPQNASFDWPKATNADHIKLLVTETSSLVESTIVKQGFSSFELSSKLGVAVETLSVGGTVDVTKGTTNSGATASKDEAHTIIGEFYVPYAQISLEASKLELTKDCKELVKKIIQGRNVEDLNKFYTTYGRVYSQHIILGGHLTTETTIHTHKSADRQKHLDNFMSSLQATIGVPLVASGSLSVSDEVQNRHVTSTSSVTVTKVDKWNSYGGDSLLITDPNKWRESLTTVKNWRPLKFGNLDKIELVIGRMEEFKNFPDIIEDILRIVKAPMIRSVATTGYYTEQALENANLQKPFNTVSLFQGLDALTGQLKPSPFKEAAGLQETTYTFMKEIDWKILDGGKPLADSLNDIRAHHSELVNLAFAPSYLSQAHVSADSAEYGLTIILRWSSGGKRFHMPNPEKVELSPEAAKLSKCDPKQFLATYGDYYIVNIERRSCAVAVWRISFGRHKQDFELFRENIKRDLASKPSADEGATMINEKLANADHPARREARVVLYRSSPFEKCLILDASVTLPVHASNRITEHVNGQGSEILTNIQVFPYKHAIPKFKGRPPPEQAGFNSWAAALQEVYLGMNDVRKLSTKQPQRAEWEKELLESEKQLLENQVAIIAGDGKTGQAVKKSVETLRGSIENKVLELRNSLGPLQEALDLWVMKSREREQLDIGNMEKQTYRYLKWHQSGEMSYKQTPPPLCLHRIESGKHRKFGLSDPPDELDLDSRTLLTKLVKKRTPLPKEYTLQYFDGMLDTQFEWLVEAAVPGYRLLAYEVTNEWWDTSKGRFWVNNAMNLVQFQQEDGASFMEPEPNVGNTGAMCVFFERPTLKSYKIQIDTWWVPQKIEEYHFKEED